MKLLDDDDLLPAGSTRIKKFKAVGRVWKEMFPVHPRSPGSPRAAQGVRRAKSKIGRRQGNADHEYKTEGDTSSTICESHRIFLV